MPSGYFIALPQELIVKVLLELDVDSLLKCGTTCRTLYRVLQGSSALQYIIELVKHGMQDAGSTVPHSELIQRLKDHQKSWEDLEWREVTVLPVNQLCIAYDFVGGMFVTCTQHTVFLLKLPLLRVGDSDNTEREGSGCTVTPYAFDIVIRDVTIDPSQDLLVVLGYTAFNPNTPIPPVHLQLRTISSNEPHPLAREFTLPLAAKDLFIPGTHDLVIHDTLIQIVDDIISVFFCRGPDRYSPQLMTWNWRQGSVILKPEYNMFPRYTKHLTMLSRFAFITTRTEYQGSLNLYLFSPSSQSSSPHLVAVFLLPPIRTEYRVQEITIHGGAPVEGRVCADDVFVPGKQNGVLVVTVKYCMTGRSASDGASAEFSIYVHTRALLRLALGEAYNEFADEYEEDPDEGFEMFAWHRWGPDHTRFLPSRTPVNWMRYVQGQRTVLNPRNGELSVVDLAPVNCDHARPASVSSSSPDTVTFVHTKNSDIRRPYLFTNAISTRLPMRLSKRSMPLDLNYDTWMIDGRHIVGVKMDGDLSTLKELHVHSF